jgi:hypothetical protein
MNKRRLLKLADLLEKDAKNKKGIKFDMQVWGVIDNPDKPMSCGTSACAMGLAALSGAFKSAGLGYEIGDDGGLWITIHGYHSPIGAAMWIFNIKDRAAAYLFLDQTGVGAKGERQVAKMIRDFVAGKADPRHYR